MRGFCFFQLPLVAQPQKESFETQTVIVLLCAVAYFFAYESNLYLFSSLESSMGVNGLSVPRGLQLLFVLLLLHVGALGIVIGHQLKPWLEGRTTLTALISGGAPTCHVSSQFS